MVYLYITIAIVILFFGYGAWTRKSLYKQVDQLEEWKLDILNRPITEEIAKVKGLTMSGETEQKFETWRKEWDGIVDVVLPDIEEDLFDVEELANKYRFNKAKQKNLLIEEKLKEVEDQLRAMLDDIDILVQSAEQNRTEIGDVKKLYQDLKKRFSSHRTSFGRAADLLEKRIEGIYEKFASFDEATKSGNYIQAREVLVIITDEITAEKLVMEAIPKFLVQLQTNIPGELKNLYFGMKDMEEAGFDLSHFNFEKDIQTIKEASEDLIVAVHSLELEGMDEKINEHIKKVDSIYDALEVEATSKQTVQAYLEQIAEKFIRTDEKIEDLNEDAKLVQQSYRVAEEQLKNHQKINKQLKELTTQLSVIEDAALKNTQSFTTLQAMVEIFNSEYEQLEEALEASRIALDTLRKDELKAKETLKELKFKLLEGKRMVQKSNIPGLPSYINSELEEGEEKLLAAIEKLQEIPLDLNGVIHIVEQAAIAVNNVYTLIEETVEKSKIAERLIQYGNRYRRKSEETNTQLSEAEMAFRSFYYDDAIELASTAIQKYEPNILEELSEKEKETVSV
ncbi:septation ring formation regulator EzrA [Alkalihalobacterium elongatum]|uniref:septation ring formation regulator EzrA n=1 Tax=Alkalihalobacterium elongatum TaxID=2675466 RepID=UPI001C1F4337|nr:septation ring formation regulator EzrA [Alkalihalobacterium elongatum]